MSGLFGGKTNNASQTQIAQGIRVQSSIYGKPLTVVYGTNRVSGNLIWYGNFQAIANKSQQGGGGKGGGSSGGSTSYTYQAAVAIAICEGPVTGIGTIWFGDSAWYPGQLTNSTPLEQLGFTYFGGSYPQTPWSYLTTNYASQALSYSGLAYVACPTLALDSGANIQNYTFEVYGLLTNGSTTDVLPGSVIQDMLTNANYGCGWQSGWIDATHMAQYQTYCQAMGIGVSPVYDSQTQAQQNLQDLLDSSNSTCWWSEGVLKIQSYCDQPVSGNGSSYTPNVTPIYALTDDDFLYQEGQDPIQISRAAPSEAYNIVDVEFVNRLNRYDTEIAEAKDLFAITQYGRRYDTVRTYHHITQQTVAQTVAQLWLQRNLYILNTYTFRLGLAFCALEPMDLVTLTDPLMGLSDWPVRITGVEENENGDLTITAEDFPVGFATAPLYTAQQNGTVPVQANLTPPNPQEIVFFEPPAKLTNNQLTIWVGAGAASVNYGGCEVWVSMDGVTYVNEGTIHGRSRCGVTTSSLPVSSDPDTTDTLSVNLANTWGALYSGSKNDADVYNTLCVLGQELISYETAALVSGNAYNLTYLRRGAYGTTIAFHPVGEQFMRFDSGVLQYQYSQSMIGVTLYFKLVPFNMYGSSGTTDLSSVPVSTYKIKGSALVSPIPNVGTLGVNYVSGITQIFWTPVTDYRPIDYEIRLGPTWGAAKVLGRTTSPTFPSQGDGTYWVAAHYITPGGVTLYSAIPADLAIAGSVLVQNVVATFDEAATGWPGTCSGGANINESINALILDGNNNFLSVASILTDPDILWTGGVQSSGSYALPPSQTVNAGYVASCSVRISYTAYGQAINANVLTLPNVLAVTDWFSVTLGALVSATPQIAVAGSNGIFGPWQDYQPGVYTGQYFSAQILLTSSDVNTTCEVTDFVFAVDVPDRVDTYTNVSVAAVGTTITFQSPPGTVSPFNGGPAGSTVPNVQVTIINAAQGDQLVMTRTLSGVTIQVQNAGVGVARVVDVVAQGY
jgi:hypothetical protein